MQLHIYTHSWERYMPDWTVAAVSGFVAGAVLMVLELLWSTIIMDGNLWQTSHMIAALTLGSDALQSSDFNLTIVAAALATHYVLGIVLGLILAAIIVPFHLDSSISMVLLTGAVFGVAVYLFNFYGMVYFFSWFAEMRGLPALLAHIVFGMAAASMYWKLEQAGQ